MEKHSSNYKIFPLISLDSHLYMVDKEAPCPKGSWAIFTDSINGKVKAFNTPALCKWDYAVGDYNLRVIATTNPSLGLPLIELEEDVDGLAQEAFEEARKNKSSLSFITWQDSFKATWIEGYKAAKAKKYTEEDMRRAIRMARETIYEGNWKTPKESDIIQSLTPIPTSVEVEMEGWRRAEKGKVYNVSESGAGSVGELYYEPKVDADSKIVVKRFIYNE